MLFHQLPDEVLRHLLFYLDPGDTLKSFQLLNRHAAQLAGEPLLWKYHCLNSFKIWDWSHGIEEMKRRPVNDFDWRGAYLKRARDNARVSELFEEILASKLNRWVKFEEICKMGYDIKEFLIDQCNVNESSESGLARRYWGRAILDNLHKNIALQKWHRLLTDVPRPDQLEEALGCFDLFVLGPNEGDLFDISRILDERATEFLASAPEFETWSTRQKAVALNRWLRAQNLTGLQNAEQDYRNLRNCLLGQALRHPDHESIPIISSAIFACIARRLSIAAGCCGFPTHVHAVVFPPAGLTLDGEPRGPSTPNEELPRMYLDPFGNDDEVPADTLRGILARFGWQISTKVALSMISNAAVVTRVANNINETNNLVDNRRAQTDDRDVAPTRDYTQLMTGHGWPVMSACQYAGRWASLILSPPNPFEWLGDMEEVFDHMTRTFPEDCWLVERYLMPLYDTLGGIRTDTMRLESRQALEFVRRADEQLGPVCRRGEGEGNVAYRVGDVFRHRRYDYFGVITGWSSKASRDMVVPGMTDEELLAHYAPLGLMHRLQMDDKTYYTFIRNMTSERYIAAEDNIELVRDPDLIADHEFFYAGKFFKRFDRENCRFVSNIREQFPDD